MRTTSIVNARWFFVFVMTLAITIYLAPAAGAKNEADPNVGMQLYKSYCLLCHGAKGNSKGPLANKLGLNPANLTSDQYQKKSIDEMTKIIGGYGRAEGDVMPVWRNALPESNIRHIAAYIASIDSTNLKFTGDVRRGRLIFRSSCVACHGSKGRGNGILAKMIGAPMADFTKDDSVKRYSDKSLMVIIRKGKEKFMPGWQGTLNNSEITDVAAYVRSLSE